MYNLIAFFERSIIVKFILCSGADIPDWKPQFPVDNYTLNMCSMLRKIQGLYMLTDEKCALFNNTVGYICEYG